LVLSSPIDPKFKGQEIEEDRRIQLYRGGNLKSRNHNSVNKRKISHFNDTDVAFICVEMSISRNLAITGAQWDQGALRDCEYFLKAFRYETFGCTENLQNNKFNVP
jgi:hypothetical protein